MSDAKDRIISAASELLEQRGFHATTINEIVERSQAPKGSIYYYFPDGKDQIASQAIKAAGQKTADRIIHNLKKTSDLPGEVAAFVAQIAAHMEKAGFSAGSPLSVVAVETSNAEGAVNDACRQAYRAMIEAFAQVLREHNIEGENAKALAEEIVLSIEGGILLGRTFHSRGPLERAGQRISKILAGIINQNEVK